MQIAHKEVEVLADREVRHGASVPPRLVEGERGDILHVPQTALNGKRSDKLRFVPEAGIRGISRGDGGFHRGGDLRVANLVFRQLHVQTVRDRVVPVVDRVVDPLAGQLLRAHLRVGEVRLIVEHREFVTAKIPGREGRCDLLRLREGFGFCFGVRVPCCIRRSVRFACSSAAASGKQRGGEQQNKYPFFHDKRLFSHIVKITVFLPADLFLCRRRAQSVPS